MIPGRLRNSLPVWLQSLALLVAGWWVFSPALRGDWIWDDDTEITQNPVLRDPAGWWKIWVAPNLPDYFPLKTTVQWVQWHFWHEQVFFYHLTNVGLHLLSAFLVWKLLSRLGLRFAWVGAVLFALHPLTVESVAWISELKNVLSLPFLLVAMICYLDWEEGKLISRVAGVPPGQRPGVQARSATWLPHYPFGSLLFFLAAMLCKTSVVMFPAVILLHAWWKRGRITWADVRASTPFFAISLALGLVTVSFQAHRALGDMNVPLGGFLWRLGWGGRAIVFYFRQSLLPFRLMPIYPNWGDHPAWLPSVAAWIAIAAVLGCLWLGRAAAWVRAILFGAGFFLLNLLPVLGLVPMSYLRISRVADHFAYLPLIGWTGLAAAGAGLIRAPAWRWVAVAAAAMALAIQARRYDGIFSREETLWSYGVAHNPEAWIAHNNLGNDFFHDGRTADAQREYEAAIRLFPSYAEAHNNLGNLLLERGRAEEAMAHYRAALAAVPGYAMPHNGIGLALLRAGRAEEALPHFQIAVRTRANYPEAHYNLGLVLAKLGQEEQAVAEYREAIRLRPDYPEAQTDLANALWAAGRPADARRLYEAALRSRPNFVEAHYNFGVLLHQTGQRAESAEQFAAAARLRPGFALAERNLGIVLRELGRAPEAEQHLARAARLEAAAAAEHR